MFPNVRLMIVATLASVAALVCGFGMFAVFRVSHEPFARSSAATASLQLIADNAAYSATDFISRAPFDGRLQLEARPGPAVMTDAPEVTGERETETDAVPATTAEGSVAAPLQASVESAGTTERSPAAAPASADSPSASDEANVTGRSGPEATPQTTIIGASEGTSPPPTVAVVTDQESRSSGASVADVGPAFAAAAVAVNDPHDVPPPPRASVNVIGPPADDAGPGGEAARKTALKKPKRLRVTVRIRRVQRVAAVQYAPSQFSQYQYAPSAEQSFGGTQVNFPTSPSQTQYFTGTAPVRQLRTVGVRPRAPHPQTNTATGGPFVSATTR